MAIVVIAVGWDVSREGGGASLFHRLDGVAKMAMMAGGLFFALLSLKGGGTAEQWLAEFPSWRSILALLGFHLMAFGVQGVLGPSDPLSVRIILIVTGVVGPAMGIVYLFLPQAAKIRNSP